VAAGVIRRRGHSWTVGSVPAHGEVGEPRHRPLSAGLPRHRTVDAAHPEHDAGEALQPDRFSPIRDGTRQGDDALVHRDVDCVRVEPENVIDHIGADLLLDVGIGPGEGGNDVAA